MKVLRVLVALAVAMTCISCGSSGTKAIVTSTATTASPKSTTTSLTSSLNPSFYGQAVTFTAAVTSSSGPPPNGEVITFKQGSNVLGTSPLNSGTAEFSISTLAAAATNSITAVYPGDATFRTSSSTPLSQVVSPASTTTNLSSSQNPTNLDESVTFTATVSPQFGGTVTGSVAFYNGSTALATVPVSGGAASYTIGTLPAGTASVTAVYEGSEAFLTSTSPVVSQVVTTGTFNETMVWDGVTRYYEVYLPKVLPAHPPLLLMLHGTRYDVPPANPTTLDWGWQPLADQYGFILVQPASTLNEKTGQWNWNAYFMDAAFTSADVGTCTAPPASSCPDDAGFLRQLITTLTAKYNVDANRVYLTGMSSGAQMAERVGVELSDIVAAIAPTSGQMAGQETPPPGLPDKAIAPISVQEWHGTLDTELPPCNYGTTNYSGVIYTLDTVDDTFNYWVQQNACTSLQTTEPLCTNGQPTAGLSGNTATGCVEDGTEVQFIWEEGLGHSWDRTNNSTRWLFLSVHPKPSQAARGRVATVQRR